jgi:hypothetical protein
MQRLARGRMQQLQTGGMKLQPWRWYGVSVEAVSVEGVFVEGVAIDWIAQHRMAKVRQVHPQLVRAAGAGLQQKQTRALEAPQHSPAGEGRLAPLPQRHHPIAGRPSGDPS